VTVTEGLRLGGVISKVRIHDGVLTGAQVAQNFTVEKTSFGYDAFNAYVKTGAPLSAGPVHRYTFNDLAGAGDGSIIPDVAGVGANQADGVLRGANATLAGTFGIDLPGGASATEAYIDLPNGIVSGIFNGGTPYTSASYEVWVTIQSNQNWSRILDFGSSDGGEVIGPGGAGSGTNYVILGANAGLDNVLRLQRFGIGSGVRQTEGNNGLGTEIHLVLTYNAVDQEWDFFRDGIAMEGFSSNGGPDTINDVNNWLGRSQWGADANTDAIYNEFRVYDYALTPDQVQGNFAAGPDVVNVIPEPSAAGLLALGAASALGSVRRRRRWRV
jgi:Concanavalin A-like lectin/glucanases superfamily